MICFKCDKCKRTINQLVYRVNIEAFANNDYEMGSPMVTEDDDLAEKIFSMHLCSDCIQQIAAMILNYNTTPAPTPQQPEKPETPEAPNKYMTGAYYGPNYRGDLDGPIRAFRMANPPRSVAWIAQELNVSADTVCRHIDKMGLPRRRYKSVVDG